MLNLDEKQLFRGLCDLYFCKRHLVNTLYKMLKSQDFFHSQDAISKSVKVLNFTKVEVEIPHKLAEIDEDLMLIFNHAKDFHKVVRNKN